MAATVITDWAARPPRLIEQSGAVVSLERTYMVYGLTGTDIGKLDEALTAAGVPTYGDVPADYPNLILDRRDCMVLSEANIYKCIIELGYESRARAGQEFVFSGGSSLVSEQRRVDYYGQLLYVTYGGDTQVGEVDSFVPQSTIEATGIVETDYPLRESHLWTGRLNALPWGDVSSSGKWMCTRVSWECIDTQASPKRYRYQYEFQVNLRGWQPQVWYVDPATGRPPGDIVAGTGYYTAAIYPYRDFNTRFQF